MKKFLLIAAMVVAAMSVNAQNYDLKNEVSISYGVGSASNYLSVLMEAFTFSSDDQTGYWGPIGIEYYHRLSPVVAIGGIGTIAGCKYDKGNSTYTNGKSLYISLMPSAKFNWLRKNSWGMYSKIAAGVLLMNSTADYKGASQSENSTNFIFQASLLGVEFGNKLCGFAEVGMGEQGILLAGLRYKF